MRKNSKKRINYELKQIALTISVCIIFFILVKTGTIEIVDNSVVNENVINTTQINEKEIEVSENIVLDNDKMNILFFDVGQADCELIICDGKTLLIDAGNVNDGEKIVDGIKKLGIQRLDYVIGTHVHEDHIGGMSYIIDGFEIGEFYLPYNVKNTTNYYKKLLNSLSEKELNINEAVKGDRVELGNSIFEFMAVDNNEPKDANESSIVVQLEYGNLKYLFMGDATTINEKSRDWEDIDLLKVGHHGSNTSNSEEFLKQVLPEISIISVGKDNSYGLPKDKIIERLNNIGTTIYRTDYDGTIQVISDGITNKVIKINESFNGNDK